MGDLSTPFSAGEEPKLSARFMNAVRDTVLAKKRTERPIRDMPSETFRQADIIKIKNDSGADRDRFDVLGVSGVLYGPADNLREFKNRPTLKGVTPALPDHRGRFVVLLEPIRAGKVGRAWASGVLPCKVDMVNAYHQFCEVEDGETSQLRSCTDGSARILFSVGDWSIIRLGDEGPQIRRARFAGTWAKGATVSVEMLEEDGTPTGEMFDCENDTADVETPNASSYGKLKACRIGDTWFLLTFECEVEEVPEP